MTVTHTFVGSTALTAGSYNEDTGEMALVVLGKLRKDGTRNAKTYIYVEVPQYVWDGLCKAESAGRFWIANIIPVYALV